MVKGNGFTGCVRSWGIETAGPSTSLRSGRDDKFSWKATILRDSSAPATNLSSRPERTLISCHAALDKATCAPFRKERRMKFAEATNLHRKLGVAKWRDLRFLSKVVVLTW
jgi:hypothetical protein